MSLNKTFLGVTAVLIILVSVIYFAFQAKQDEVGRHYTGDISIEQTWELPKILEEISGIAYLGDDRIACIQDEDGIIFIYDLQASEIIEQIEFSDGGDYEGIALDEDIIYVLESNGTVYRVATFLSDPQISKYSTPLTEKQDVEGLCFDRQNNRLLLAIKGKEPGSANFKGIYAVDPHSMEMQEEPVFKLLFRDPVFAETMEKKEHNTFNPSEININPENGKIYMLEATNPKLLILASNGKPEKLRFLNKNDFPQPEGITFDDRGNTYISNEGTPATIHRITLKN